MSCSPGEAPILAGTCVVIQGLVARPDLNGCPGVVAAFDQVGGRYVIRLDGTESEEAFIRVKAPSLIAKRRVLSEAAAEALARLMVGRELLPESTVFTTSAVVTQSHLQKEIVLAAVAGGGRVSLAALRTSLGVESLGRAAEALVKASGHRLVPATDDLVTFAWAESLAAAVAREAIEAGAVSCNQRSSEAKIPTDFLETAVVGEGISSGRLGGVRLDAKHRCVVSLAFDRAVTDALSQACCAAAEPLSITSRTLRVDSGRPPTIHLRTSSEAFDEPSGAALFRSILDDEYISAIALTLAETVPGLIRGGGRE
jgi:hypothetical protein